MLALPVGTAASETTLKRFYSHTDERIRKIVRDIGGTVSIPATDGVVRVDWSDLEGDK